MDQAFESELVQQAMASMGITLPGSLKHEKLLQNTEGSDAVDGPVSEPQQVDVSNQENFAAFPEPDISNDDDDLLDGIPDLMSSDAPEESCKAMEEPLQF